MIPSAQYESLGISKSAFKPNKRRAQSRATFKPCSHPSHWLLAIKRTNQTAIHSIDFTQRISVAIVDALEIRDGLGVSVTRNVITLQGFSAFHTPTLSQALSLSTDILYCLTAIRRLQREMPKAKPLPVDPIAREKLIKRRRQIKQAVIKWRSRNQAASREYGKMCMQRHRLSRAARRRIALLKLAA